MTSPSTRPPTRAPYALPIPPSTTAAKIGSRSVNPKFGVNALRTSAWSRPAIPASPPATIQVRTTVRSTSIPATAASELLSERARIALPSPVRASISPTKTIAAAAIATATTWLCEKRTGPSS